MVSVKIQQPSRVLSDMSLSGMVGEGLAILQLRKWRQLNFQLDLSGIIEASISPTKELLVLLSHESEAFLFPLTNGKVHSSTYIEKDHTKKLNYDKFKEGNSLLSISQKHAVKNEPGSLHTSSNPDKPADSPECTSASEQCPLICDVKSLAWGHAGDIYNQGKDFIFREVLVVSNGHDITMHVFGLPGIETDITNSSPENGTWVIWGPSHDRQAKHQFKAKSSSNAFDFKTDDSVEIDGKIHTNNKADKDNFPNRNPTQNNWLQAFYSQLETCEIDGSFFGRFPEKESIPCSADVVSFDISDCTFKFLDFLSQNDPSISHENNKLKEKRPGSKAVHHYHSTRNVDVNSNSLSYSSNAGASPQDDVCNIDSSYKCSKVFASSSYHLIGLVLTCVDSEPTKVSKENIKVTNQTLIIIVTVHFWAVQWLCCVDINGSRKGPYSEWADFQFSDNFLVCLDTSGLINVWDAKNGNTIANFHVLQRPDRALHSNFDHAHLFAAGMPHPLTGRSDRVKDNITSLGSELLTGSHFGKTKFRRLMISSCPMLLAVVNDQGVIYVIHTEDYFSKQKESGEPVFGYQDPVLGVLSSWDIAGNGISCPKMFSDIFKGSFSITHQSGHFSHLKEKSHCSHTSRSQCSNYLSGFSPFHTLDCKFSTPNPSETLRRVFLPIDGYNMNDSICLSPFGITRFMRNLNDVIQPQRSKVVHTCLNVASVLDERDLGGDQRTGRCLPFKGSSFADEAIGCCFYGSLYLVTQDGLFIVLPSVSTSPDVMPAESSRHWQPNSHTGVNRQAEYLLVKNQCEELSPWQINVLDRIILYEGPDEADSFCLGNGWDLKIARIHQMKLALDYVNSDAIERCLELLADVNLAEEGILCLLFSSIYQIFCKVGTDNEVALASRFLSLAACFATKMVRRYGLLKYEKECAMVSIDSASILQHDSVKFKANSLKRLEEMSYFLQIIRNIQVRLISEQTNVSQPTKDESPHKGLMVDDVHDDSEINSEVDTEGLPSVSEGLNDHKLELATIGFSGTLNSTDLVIFPTEDVNQRKKMTILENPRDMIERWCVDNFDIATVVRDALDADRLPLAVLQLHLRHSKEVAIGKEPHDTFSEVHAVGRAIVYDLFFKGESKPAIAALQRLGEDIEFCLRELLFGTVRRSVRIQISEEMKILEYLKLNEMMTLDRICLIESLYPSNSFWRTYMWRQKKHTSAICFDFSEENQHLFNLNLLDSFSIFCEDIDGVVTGIWENFDENVAILADNEDDHAGYWACAAVWSDAWDQRTIDRIMLDNPRHEKIHVPWESLLDYHISHNDWQEVVKILDVIPKSSLSEGRLIINIEGSHADQNLDPVCIYIPSIKILRFQVSSVCSLQMKMLVEQELAKKFIFLKSYWECTEEIIPLLVRSGLVICKCTNSSDAHSSDVSKHLHQDTIYALHRLVIRHCADYNLPNLLDIYLDHNKLVLDRDFLFQIQHAAEGCQWAKWLLFSRVKGFEYDASFCNARSIFPQNLAPERSLNVLDVDEILLTVDDMAEGGGEMAALATLMYAPLPIQKCLCYGSVSRQCGTSFQCTLENLRPGFQQFPTLWRTLVSACFGQDTYDYPLSPRSNTAFGRSAFSDYLIWRNGIFSSAGGDTSLIQMLPCWFPKPIRRLIKLLLQGPLGWQSLSSSVPTEESFINRGIGFVLNADENSGFSAISWEAAIQRSIEEHYSSCKENAFGIEHHLHRGRPLAAFIHIIDLRISELKSAYSSQEASGSSTTPWSKNHLEMQTLLEPCSPKERSLISSVMPLAVMHFEDPVLVASCAFLLELCGLSANMLHLDVAVLQRISTHYKSNQTNTDPEHVSPKGSAFHAVPRQGDLTISLARILADDYLRQENLDIHGENDIPRDEAIKKSSRGLMIVLKHLEKASLPIMSEGQTCGSWLSNGDGDGHELRSQQKAASQNWYLVTTFCGRHHLPPSTKYLAALAKDNDWVGFLAEAQIERIPHDLMIQLANEFTDPRLKMHILTVLKSMRSKKSTSLNSLPAARNGTFFCTESSNIIPDELFGLVAQCESQGNPGMALLAKAKVLRWSLIAMVASCFPDVSSLSCLTVWLQISASRETSSIKVSDMSSQIASNIEASVHATNSLSSSSRSITVHYNRKTPKRRRLMDDSMLNSSKNASFDIPDSSNSENIHASQEVSIESDGEKVDLQSKNSNNADEDLESLSNMVVALSEQHLFLLLLRAFEMFLPSCSLLPFIRSLQAFFQMRLSEASTHLLSFSAKIKDQPSRTNLSKDDLINVTWIRSTAVKAADAMLKVCPSSYERRCLLKLLANADFGDGGSAAAHYRKLLWKINLSEPLLGKDDYLFIGCENLDDASLLIALEKNGRWEEARDWAKKLELTDTPWNLSVHHVTEMQANTMVMEWKEFLWDVPDERAAIWCHCQALFIKHSFPALQAGNFFLNHAEMLDEDIRAIELHEMLILSLQWLCGIMTQSDPVYPLHMLREIETRIWLLAVESEAQYQSECDFTASSSLHNPIGRNSTSVIEHTAMIISNMDNHINALTKRNTENNRTKESGQLYSRSLQGLDTNTISPPRISTKIKRRSKPYQPSRQSLLDNVEQNIDAGEFSSHPHRSDVELSRNLQIQEENVILNGWEERVQPAEVERAVLSLLEFGQISAARQLQQKLSPDENVPPELLIVDASLKLASLKFASFSSISSSGPSSISMLDPDVLAIIESYDVTESDNITDSVQILESVATKCRDGCGRGLCNRIVAVVKAAKVLCIPFSEAFEKRPVELLQLLSLKAQDSFEEAKLLVQTHTMPSARVAHVLAESFLKGLVAAHRGGYLDSQKEEGPAPLLWRFSDFLKWAELCPSDSEIGHALMRLVITSQEIPHDCEVELLLLSHHFYKSSSCLDGVDVLVTLVANRVKYYVSEGDFSCLARLVTGVSNFHALNFILGLLIENGQLELLLHKYSAADATTCTTEAADTGFQMAIVTSLKHFNPDDQDALAMVYSHFDMKYDSAALLESRSNHLLEQWYESCHKDSGDLLESMLYLIEAAEVYSTVDAGQKAYRACARASLISLQIRFPDSPWMQLSETKARRAIVDQSRFQEAFTMAEAYILNRSSEWVQVIWEQMFKPDQIEQFLSDFVVILPLYPSMLLELARFHRSHVVGRGGDISRFPSWGTPAESKNLGRSFRSLLRRTRDLRFRVQLATTATGFPDIIKACNKALDKIPGLLILRRGHGGAYLPIV